MFPNTAQGTELTPMTRDHGIVGLSNQFLGQCSRSPNTPWIGRVGSVRGCCAYLNHQDVIRKGERKLERGNLNQHLIIRIFGRPLLLDLLLDLVVQGTMFRIILLHERNPEFGGVNFVDSQPLISGQEISNIIICSINMSKFGKHGL